MSIKTLKFLKTKYLKENVESKAIKFIIFTYLGSDL